MKWRLITDSSCDLRSEDEKHEGFRFSSIPFLIRLGRKEYVDDEQLDTAQFVDEMEAEKEASHTACPAPDAWVQQFEGDDPCIALTVSSELSGSYNSACVAKNMVLEKSPDRKIAVIDSRSAGSALVLACKKLHDLMAQHIPFDEMTAKAEQLTESIHTVFALCSFDNLVRNGRMSRLVGMIAGKLQIWGIGVSDKGKLRIKDKVRGVNHVLNKIVEDMISNGFNGTQVVISHCLNQAVAEKLREKIRATWAEAEVTILRTRGLCSYYAERGGMIIAY